jgi:diguanylate cyclase (GGDEF)-like protein
MIILPILMTLPLFIYASLTTFSVRQSLTELEKTQLKSVSGQIQKALSMRLNRLEQIVIDYGQWDETYEAVENPDETWFAENLSGWLPEGFDLDVVTLTNREGEVIDSFGKVRELREKLKEQEFFKEALKGKVAAGIFSTQKELMIIAYSPVTQNSSEPPFRGVLVLGQKINRGFTNVLSDLTGPDIIIFSPQKTVSSVSKKATAEVLNYLSQKNKPFEIKEWANQTGTLSKAYSFITLPLKDIYGKKIGLIVALTPRKASLAALSAINQTSNYTMAVTLALSLIVALFLAHLLTRKITLLATAATQVTKGNLNTEIEVTGKDEISQLGYSFQKMLEAIRRKIDELNNTHVELERLRRLAEERAITDDLTKVRNYRFFKKHLVSELKRAKRYHHKVALLMLDLDYFKMFNDINGHPSGNLALYKFASILRHECRETDLVARYGGEEFAILLPEISLEKAILVAEKLRQKTAETPFSGEEVLPGKKLTVSIGIALFPEDAEDPDELVKKADWALYKAKQKGKNRIEVYQRVSQS